MKNRYCEPNTGHLVVIGYGNELRSDDSVGPRVAETVATWKLPRIRIIVCHQLAPELVIPIAAAGRVVFVDAAKDAPGVQTRELVASHSEQLMTHAAHPQALLQLTRTLYGRCPPAWWLTIPAEDFGFGQTLSPKCQEGMRTALHCIRDLAERGFGEPHVKKRQGFAKSRVAGRRQAAQRMGGI